jgi:hypothetical protein
MATSLRIVEQAFLVAGLALTGSILPALADCPGQVRSEDTMGLPCGVQQQQEDQQRQMQQQQQQQQQQSDQEWQNTVQRQQAQQQANVAQGQQVLRTWQSRPPLPPDHNPLLGRWNSLGSGAATQQNTRNLSGTVGPEMAQLVASMLGGMTAGLCDSMLGQGLIEFGPTSVATIGRDGSSRVLYHASYRGGGTRVVVLPKDAANFTHMIIDFDRPDHGVVAGVGCVIARPGAAGAKTAAQSTPAGSGSGSAAGTAASAGAGAGAAAMVGGNNRASGAGGAAGGAVLDLTAGVTDKSGQYHPEAGREIRVMKGSADMALIDGGFKSYGGPMHSFMIACTQNTPDCHKAWTAIQARTVSLVKTDASGHARMASLPAGRYYVFGTWIYDNHPMVWQEPIDLHAGGNTLALDLKNAYRIE